MPSDLDILQQAGRFDISGNRMTVYAPMLGGGSIAYINGLWTNNTQHVPVEMMGVFSGHDGDLEIIEPASGMFFSQPYETIWRPYGIESSYAGPAYCDISEFKTIYNDVFVSRISVSNSITNLPHLMCRFGHNLPESEVVHKDYDFIHAYSDSGPLKGIHRIIGFPGIEMHKGSNSIPIELGPAETGAGSSSDLFFIVAMDEDIDAAIGKFREIAALGNGVFEKIRREWETYFRELIPQTDLENRLWQKAVYSSFFVYKANQINYISGAWKHRFTCPSKFRLRLQWFWDSAFQAIGESYMQGAAIAKSSLKNIAENQSEDGHMIFMLDKEGDFLWKTKLSEHKLVQPFIFPIAVWQILNVTGDIRFAESMLEPMMGLDRFMEKHRTDDETGLVHIKCGAETGWDNSIRFHPELHDSSANFDLCTKSLDRSRIQPVDYNTYIYLGKCIIARLLDMCGRSREAKAYVAGAEKLGESILECFNESIGMFSDRVGAAGKLTAIKSAGGFIPMMLGQLPEEMTNELISHLTDKDEFWTEFPVPTLSIDDRWFSADNVYHSYWNGRTWMPVNWLICQGLIANGQYRKAAKLIEKCFAMVVSTGKVRITENYHPLQPMVYSIYHNIFNYGWSGLLTDLFYRNIIGLVPRAYENKILLNPVPVEGSGVLTVKNISIGSHVLSLNMKRTADKFSYKIEHSGPEPVTILYNDRQVTVDNKSVALDFVQSYRPFSWIPVVETGKRKACELLS